MNSAIHPIEETPKTRATVAPGAVWILVLVQVFAIPGSRCVASTIAAKPQAAFAGNYGIEVGVDSNCTGSDDLALGPQTISTTEVFEACETISADGVVVQNPGDLTLRAGTSVTLEHGFSVASDAQLAVEIDQQLVRIAYVEDRSPLAEKRYRARFYLQTDQLLLGPFEDLDHLGSYSNNGTAHFRLMLRDSAGQRGLALAAREDDGTVWETPAGQEALLASGWHCVELDWMASDPGLANGHLEVWLNDQPAGTLSNLDNDQAKIDFVRWGLVDSSLDSSTGSIFVDEFVSKRAGYIGPLP